MKTHPIPLTFFLLFFTSLAYSQDLVRTKDVRADSFSFKNRGVYVVINPCVIGSSINADNNYRFGFIASKLKVNWFTKKGRKFAWLGSIGTGNSTGSKSMNIYETGFLTGILVKGKRKGVYDVNFGIALLGRKAKDPWLSLDWGPYPPEKEEVREVHTIGIPFDCSVNTIRGVLGIGIGISGNLNLNQPFIAVNLRLRFGYLTNQSNLYRRKSSSSNN